VVLCPDVVPYIDSRFDCCDLLQRSVIHYGAERKASSAIISIPHSGRNDRNAMLRVYLAALSKVEGPDLFPFRFRPGHPDRLGRAASAGNDGNRFRQAHGNGLDAGKINRRR
jgi:hypothetical protein